LIICKKIAALPLSQLNEMLELGASSPSPNWGKGWEGGNQSNIVLKELIESFEILA